MTERPCAGGRPSFRAEEGLCFPEWPDQSHKEAGRRDPGGHVHLRRQEALAVRVGISRYPGEGDVRGGVSDHQTDDSKEKLQPLGLLLPIWAPGVLVHGCHWGGICLLPEGRVSMGRMRISLDFNAAHGVPAPTHRGGQATCIRHPRPCGLMSLNPKATVCLKCTSVKA